MRNLAEPAPRWAAAASAAVLLAILVVPLLALLWSASPASIASAAAHPRFLPALTLSLGTSLVSLSLTVALGLPLAWWLARSGGRWAPRVSVLVELPIVIPPAVLGVALLQAFGRSGVLGPVLHQLGLALPFTSAAVVLAQMVVSAPFFVQTAATALRRVDVDHLLVARTLGASPMEAFFRVALPMATPGLVAAASLAWARALGELGATLLFAGNLPGRTQTMPLAILTAFESDVQVAITLSLLLIGVGALLLGAIHAFSNGTSNHRDQRSSAG